MGSIDIIKPQSSVLSSAVNKSQQYQEKNSWECRKSNLGQLGAKESPPFPAKTQELVLVRVVQRNFRKNFEILKPVNRTNIEAVITWSSAIQRWGPQMAAGVKRGEEEPGTTFARTTFDLTTPGPIIAATEQLLSSV